MQEDSVPKKNNNNGLNEIKYKLANSIVNPPQFSAVKKASKKARVIYSYVPQNDDELPLEIGQLVEVLKQDEPGWWEGNLNGHVGMFPSNFVELIEKDEYSETPEIKGRKVVGVGFGPNIFDNGQIALRQINPISPPREKQSVMTPTKAPSGMKSSTSLASDDRSYTKAKVIYEYKAENPDELNLNVGDTIVVLDQNLEDVGWWKGDLNGKIGVFPDNFVELMTSEDKLQKRLPPDPEYKRKIGTANMSLAKPKLEDVNVSEFARGLPKKPTNSSNFLHKPLIQRKDELPLKPQLKDSKDTSVSPARPDANAMPQILANLRRDIGLVRDQLERMKRDHEKILLQLMSEIDDEKRNRFNIQVEIDRIKKLISSSAS